MGDRYLSFAASGPGRGLFRRLGLPSPFRLRRYQPGEPPVPGPVLLGGDGRPGAHPGQGVPPIGGELRDPAAPGGGAPPPNPAPVVAGARLPEPGPPPPPL